MAEGGKPTQFRLETIEELLNLHFKNKSKRKIDAQALKLLRELLATFVNETIYRSVAQAKISNDTMVSMEHLEKILPQLLLDF